MEFLKKRSNTSAVKMSFTMVSAALPMQIEVSPLLKNLHNNIEIQSKTIIAYHSEYVNNFLIIS